MRTALLVLFLLLSCPPSPGIAAEEEAQPLVLLLLQELQGWQDLEERVGTGIRLLDLLEGQPWGRQHDSILALAESAYGQSRAEGRTFYPKSLWAMASAYSAAGRPERAMEWAARFEASLREEEGLSDLDSRLDLAYLYAVLGRESQRLDELARLKVTVSAHRMADQLDLQSVCLDVREAIEAGLWQHALDVARLLGCSMEEHAEWLLRRLEDTGDPALAEVVRGASEDGLMPPATARDAPELKLQDGKVQEALRIWCARQLRPDGSCPPEAAVSLLAGRWIDMKRRGRDKAAALLLSELDANLEEACCGKEWTGAATEMAVTFAEAGQTEKALPLLERVRSSGMADRVLWDTARLLEAALKMQDAGKREVVDALLVLWIGALKAAEDVRGGNDIVAAGLLGRLRRRLPETSWRTVFEALEERLSRTPDGESALVLLGIGREWLDAGDAARARQLLLLAEPALPLSAGVHAKEVHSSFGRMASRLDELERGRSVLAQFVERERKKRTSADGSDDLALKKAFQAAQALVAAGPEYADLAAPHLDAWTKRLNERFSEAVQRWQAKDAQEASSDEDAAWSGVSFGWSEVPEQLRIASETARSLHEWGLTKRADEVRKRVIEVIDATGHHAARLESATALVESFPAGPDRTAAAVDAVDARFAFRSSLRSHDERRAADWPDDELRALAELCGEKKYGEPTGIDSAPVARRILDVLRREATEKQRCIFVNELLRVMADR
jgi:hypothetical protein